ncbi:MAG: hypothetical protein H0X25_15505 [Acidobacteriales bacterium]|nr:hypothetical protein [Terriglobales bacterium]
MTLAAWGQQPFPPTLSFTLDFPGSNPDHYVITVAADGKASYDSTGKLTPESEDDPFHLEFDLPPATAGEFFELAKKAGYFEGNVDSGKQKLASTGIKTLAYHDAERNTRAQYNYSTNAAVQQLTSRFQDLSQTLEFGRRLDYYHHYQKLALDDETKSLDSLYSRKAAELLPIAPILQQLLVDQSVITPVRMRVQRLLTAAGVTK